MFNNDIGPECYIGSTASNHVLLTNWFGWSVIYVLDI